MLSTCPKCGGHLFEIEENSPDGSAYKIYFVQCTSCGNPVGTEDFFNVNSQIEILEKKINQIDQKINDIDNNVADIANRLSR